MAEGLPFAPPQELTEADRHLEAVIQRLTAESIPTLEAHARQVVALSTTLLAAFFGLLSLEQSPSFLARPPVRALAGLTLVGFFAGRRSAVSRRQSAVRGQQSAVGSRRATAVNCKTGVCHEHSRDVGGRPRCGP